MLSRILSQSAIATARAKKFVIAVPVGGVAVWTLLNSRSPVLAEDAAHTSHQPSHNHTRCGWFGSSTVDSMLTMREFRPLVLKERTQVNDNSVQLVFEDPKNRPLEFDVSSFVLTRAGGWGPWATYRPYTPIDWSQGQLTLMVKHYPNGKMSPRLFNMKVGDSLDFRGPIHTVDIKANTRKSVTLIGGGAGITPLYQVVKTLLSNPDDHTKITLLYSNVEEKDIWLRSELDALARQHPRFDVQYFLEKPPAQWSGSVGRIDEPVLKSRLPEPTKDNLVMVCGPPGMMKTVSGESWGPRQGKVQGILKDMGFSSDNVWKF